MVGLLVPKVMEPPKSDPSIVHQDEHLLTVDKPAGWIVIPGRGEPEKTVRAFAEERFGPVWVVHRIDRGTSGLVLFARSAVVHRALSVAFEKHDIGKKYLAVVAGSPPEHLRLDVPLVSARRGKMRPARPGEAGAKAAATRLRLLRTLGRFALVELEPETGRTHQIRVHLRSAGFPLALDPEYGQGEPLLGQGGEVLMRRTPLHASELRFKHPVSGSDLVLSAPLPADMTRLIQVLGQE